MKTSTITLVACTIVVVAMAINFKSIHAYLLAAEPFAQIFSCIGISAAIGGLCYQLFKLWKGGRNV